MVRRRHAAAAPAPRTSLVGVKSLADGAAPEVVFARDAGHCLPARRDARLVEDALEMRLDRVLADAERLGDRAVRQTLQQQRCNLALAHGQTERLTGPVRARRVAELGAHD